MKVTVFPSAASQQPTTNKASSAQAASATTLTAACASYQQRSRKKTSDPNLHRLAETIFRNVPSGLGSRRKDFTISNSDLDNLAVEGVHWLIKRGYGWPEDAEHCEERGCMPNANPDKVSSTAKSRGLTQIGTLGSGNHFLEIQKVDKIYQPQNSQGFRNHSGRSSYSYDSLWLKRLRTPSLLRLPTSYGARQSKIQNQHCLTAN